MSLQESIFIFQDWPCHSRNSFLFPGIDFDTLEIHFYFPGLTPAPKNNQKLLQDETFLADGWHPLNQLCPGYFY